MSEEIKIELSDAEFTAFCDLASKNGITPEEQAARIIEASFSERHSRQASEVSTVFLRDNMEAVLDVADRGPVYITTGTGREFVLLSKQEYDRLLASECAHFGWLFDRLASQISSRVGHEFIN